MLFFVNDYSQCAHDRVMEHLQAMWQEKNAGYGSDKYSEAAKEKIRAACRLPEAQVELLVGGTQTNQLVIDTMLAPYEGVVAAETGHVSVHEAGAIEFTGHKVLTVPQHEGKLDAAELGAYVDGFFADDNHEHMVFPGMVYISQPTEYGTLYSRAELEAIRAVCVRRNLTLYVDGARLGYALACPENDVSLPELARLADVFYIGGTKVGTMFGEAVVFTKNNRPQHFLTRIKQHGALLAKGWLLGVQFDALFTDGFYEHIGEGAIRAAQKIRAVLKECGYRFLLESPTNQILVVLDNATKEKLSERVAFSFWEKIDEDHTAIRFCTSWATRDDEVDGLIEVLKELCIKKGS